MFTESSSVAVVTQTIVAINAVNASTVITLVTDTVIDVKLTTVAVETIVTRTSVASPGYQIAIAMTTVFFTDDTFPDVPLTVTAFPILRTMACVVPNAVHTRGPVLTRLRQTFIGGIARHARVSTKMR